MSRIHISNHEKGGTWKPQFLPLPQIKCGPFFKLAVQSSRAMSRGESSKGLLGCFGLRSTQLVHFATLCKVTQSEHFSHDISDSIPGKPYFCIMHSSVVFSSKRCKFLELIFWENRNVFHPHSETQIGVNILVIEFQG